MKGKIKKIIAENKFQNIWYIGEIDDSGSIKELIKNTNFIYFELGRKIIRLKAIESYGRISVKLFEDFEYEYAEDIAKVNMGNIIFLNPLVSNGMRRMGFINLEERPEELIADSISIKLENGQELFIDPSFCELKIGGVEQKGLWEKNLSKDYLNKIRITWI